MVSETLSKAINDEGGTALALSDAEIVAAWRQEIDLPSDGCEDITPEFPSVRIVQGTSSMDGASKHLGEFYHSDTGIYVPELNIVGLVKQDTRALFPGDSDQPLCRSVGGVVPVPNQPLWEGTANGPQPEFCRDCPFAEWIDNQPPKCRESMVILIDRGQGDLAQLRISGMSMRPFRQFVRKLKGRGLSLFTQRLTMFTEEHTERAGKKWHELVVTGKLMAPREADAYKALLVEQRARFAEGIATEGGHVESWADGDGGRDADDTAPFE